MGDDMERGQSKSEKKVRKAVEKLGLKKVQGINKVSIRKQKTVFVILSPDVYKAGKNDGFVVFGEAKVEDSSAQSLQNAFAQGGGDFSQFQNLGGDDDGPPGLVDAGDGAAADAGAGGADEAGVEQKDIELVMAQVNCTRAQAVSALRKNDNDIV